MPCLKTCLAAAALACVASADTIKVTATSGNTFNPDAVKAEVGDTIEFHFQARNHSVVSGVFENPCSPMQLGSGFYSGFMPATGGEASKVFRIKVNSLEPVPFYSSQGDECPKGMVGIINPNGNKNLDTYRNQARALSRSVTPGSSPYGGELDDNDDPRVPRNPDGTVKAAAGALSVPMMSLAAAVGLAALMV
ncbi:extracellular serine-rich protein [Hirsutella rhossiliensis]|uniref:Extracellular serine-rich protein n=1 Tax=Hirsutella rhossiliensis TaxID=111463 RepID=A0A9P8SL90_9HYPO|nr:extracellular serine-rich protein [Hirsutella rhossiliensis]KAH0965570.1 extracellular serine-rich protein [Hirsutella rhossiliensis]